MTARLTTKMKSKSMLAIASVALSAALTASSNQSSLAQSENTETFDAKLPGYASKIAAFVPHGWHVKQTLDSDLNHDGKPDKTLCLLQDRDKNDPDGGLGRALIVLLKEGNGYKLAGVGDRVLLCTTCGGALSNGEESVDIEIKDSVIIIKQLWGSREACDCLLRLAVQGGGAKGAGRPRVRLIGADIDNYDRATGTSEITSTNYLTFDRIITNKQVDQNGKTLSSKSRHKKIKPVTYHLEGLDPQELAELP